MRHCLMIMLVVIGILSVNMDMCMGVCMLMGMDSFSVAVFMDVVVAMLMGVL